MLAKEDRSNWTRNNTGKLFEIINVNPDNFNVKVFEKDWHINHDFGDREYADCGIFYDEMLVKK